MSVEERKATPKVGPRRRGRECAVQTLYQIDSLYSGIALGSEVEHELDLFWTHFAPRDDANPETMSFARKLVRGVVENAGEIDDTLERSSENWRVERMSRVDRNVLRLAVYEMLFVADGPPRRVVMNEAIELGKKFGTEESGAFINGILDRIGQEYGLEPPGRRGQRRRGGRGKRG